MGRIADFFMRRKAEQPAETRTVKQGATRSYKGAAYNSLLNDWVASSTSFDAELRTSLRSLRNRSREIVRDNDYARNAVRIFKNNVIGAQGIQLQAQVKTKRGDKLNDKANQAIEAAFKRWTRAKFCHTGGKLSFADIQRQAIHSIVTDGEVIIRLVTQSFGGSKIPLGLEIIEADQLAEEYNVVTAEGNNVRMGVEVDRWGRPVAYWMRPYHPGDYAFTGMIEAAKTYERIPADEIIHLFVPVRPGQTRGEPQFASTLTRIRHMGGYEEAEIVAARAQACTVGFITSQPEAFPDDGSMDGDNNISMNPGEVLKLNPGETFQGFAPTRPGGQYDPFMSFMLRGFAAGIGMSFESLSRDYSKSNYSSSRLALLDDRDNWKTLQNWFCEQFNQRVFCKWLEMAHVSGVLALPDYWQQPEVYEESVKWKTRGWGWIDPQKEVSSYMQAVRAGFMSISDVVDIMGDEFEEVIKRKAYEKELCEKYGIVLDTDANATDNKGSLQQTAQPLDRAADTESDDGVKTNE